MSIDLVSALRGLTLLLACIPFAGSLRAAERESLTVAVAANMSYAFEELKTAFTRQTGIRTNSIVSSSGKIAAQVQSGAPFDVFLSADTQYPEALAKQQLTASEPKVYAFGVLVLWTTKAIDVNGGLAILSGASIGKIAIANPDVAPYGRAAVAAMTHAGIFDTVKSKLVFGESIAQTGQFIETGAADIGFTAKSVVLAPDIRGKGNWVEVAAGTYPPIAQAAVILRHGRDNHPEEARQFLDFLFTNEARAILSRYGYALP